MINQVQIALPSFRLTHYSRWLRVLSSELPIIDDEILINDHLRIIGLLKLLLDHIHALLIRVNKQCAEF
jgi:hypothetical protein